MTFSFRVCGSYEVIVGGLVSDGLVDFTGGIDEYVLLDHSSTASDYKEEIKRLLCQAIERKSMVGCSISKSEDESSGAESSNMGLVSGKNDFSTLSKRATEWRCEVQLFSMTSVKDCLT